MAAPRTERTAGVKKLLVVRFKKFTAFFSPSMLCIKGAITKHQMMKQFDDGALSFYALFCDLVAKC